MGSSRDIFTPTGANQVRLFLILFCLMIVAQCGLSFRDQWLYFQTCPSKVYGPSLRLLGLFRLPTLNARQFKLAGFGLMTSLLGATLGVATWALLLLALGCYTLYFSQIMSLAYVQRKTNLIPLTLLILSVAPESGESFGHPAPLWPIVLVKVAIAQVYFSAGLQKLRHAGWRWADGHALQAYLLEHYLWIGTPGALWLARRHTLCRVFSSMVLGFELTFWLIVLFPPLVPLYVVGSLCFHVATVLLMRINYLKYLSPVYMVFGSDLILYIMGLPKR